MLASPPPPKEGRLVLGVGAIGSVSSGESRSPGGLVVLYKPETTTLRETMVIAPLLGPAKGTENKAHENEHTGKEDHDSVEQLFLFLFVEKSRKSRAKHFRTKPTLSTTSQVELPLPGCSEVPA
ncbi:uncharacterized protein PV06_07153 [Exophiala oligosperma]|uniref:Uncharacterized protein n=1 Tax=Exophiala oligosperma TaxID=215243 RepID=A0A0D2BVZ9_9EURO|nr:uncharacterized protein PV06_07153 [Exophiala oligosperma]KIW41612.1 hypothetical protein PV06_07153 [Exophiala oligosperma]